jgi:predicted GIY-YIG superfamily endonuclease
VASECLTYAVTALPWDDQGIYAGTTNQTRRRLRTHHHRTRQVS